MRKKGRKSKKILKLLLLVISLGVVSTILSIGYFYLKKVEILQNTPIKAQGTFVASPTLDEYKKALDDKGILYDKLEFLDDESGLKAQIKDGPMVYFATSKDLAYQISSLQSILSHPTIDTKKPKRIDFRFEKIVVNF